MIPSPQFNNHVLEVRDLAPLPGQQKSFYGKAKVATVLKETLYSYETPVLEHDLTTDVYRQIQGGWSTTTAQHIQAFCHTYVPKAFLMKYKTFRKDYDGELVGLEEWETA